MPTKAELEQLVADAVGLSHEHAQRADRWQATAAKYAGEGAGMAAQLAQTTDALKAVVSYFRNGAPIGPDGNSVVERQVIEALKFVRDTATAGLHAQARRRYEIEVVWGMAGEPEWCAAIEGEVFWSETHVEDVLVQVANAIEEDIS